MTFMCGAPPVKVFSSGLQDPAHLEDCVAINLSFADGSVGTICYFSNGSKEMTKEYVEIYKSGMIARIEDYKELVIYSKGRPTRTRLISQDKGQANMISLALKAVSANSPSPIPFTDCISATQATFAAVRSLRVGLPITLSRID